MKNRALIILAVIAVCVICVVTAFVITRRTWTEQTIFLQVHCNGLDRLFAINPDGTGFRPVVWEDAYNVVPSPDGRYFFSESEKGIDLASMDGKSRRRIGERYGDVPVFSPDSRMIGNVSYSGKSFVESVDGGYRRVFSVIDGGGLAFSPDGRHIAFHSGPGPHYRIYISDLDGRNRRFLANGDNPVFSLDGKTVAFTSERGSINDLIYLIDINGKHERLLTKHNSRAFYPIFSPDGKKIAFRAEQSGGDIGLYTIDIDGTNQCRLSRGPSIGGAAFSPNGEQVVYSADSGVYIVPSNGGSKRLLSAKGRDDLYWVAARSIPANPRPTCPGLPAGYFVDEVINADFDGDGKKEQACTAAEAVPPSVDILDGSPKPIFVFVSKGDNLIGQFEYKEKNRVSSLNATDLTGDGIPELTYSAETYGGSDSEFEFYAQQWKDNAFRNMFGANDDMLSHMSEGGVVALSNGPKKPSSLVLYDFIWGDNESHADPHRYWADWYELRNGKLVKSIRKETKNKYYDKHPLNDFGIKVPSSIAKQL